ncbi:hypothetical protein QVD17_11531 [Tagetes erecta]|uniref:Uncharacterized protein n=1 Tax=Tagetes erecta TaxID=13708 RepID=A0AAD8KVC2_TARER|nr:hypothetical protein QVD17_11531 [Tagetes erecta]
MHQHVSIFRPTSLLCSVSRLSPACSILFPASSSNLSLSVSALSLRNRNRLTSIRLCGSSEEEIESVDDEDELDGTEEDLEYDFEDAGDDNLDVDELKLEAVKAVREYASPLSQELKIGACFVGFKHGFYVVGYGLLGSEMVIGVGGGDGWWPENFAFWEK